jgi:WD40 repeat protein
VFPANLIGKNTIRQLPQDHSLEISDRLCPYFIARNKTTTVLWDVDSESSMQLKISNASEESREFFFPFFKEGKIGILNQVAAKSVEHDWELQYSIYSHRDRNFTKVFDSNDGYVDYFEIKYKNQNCLLLLKNGGTCDTRTLDTWTLINKDSNYTFPPVEYIGHPYVSDRLYVSAPFWGYPNDVRVWDYIEKKFVATFTGKAPFFGFAIDNSDQLGAFFTKADSLLPSGKLKKQYSIQVQSLTTGQIQSQIIYDHLPCGMKFSPLDSQILLIWNAESDEAMLWKRPTFDEVGQIITRIKLIHNQMNRMSKHSKKRGDCNRLGECGAVFSSDGKKIAFAYDDFSVFIYSAETGKFLRKVSIKPPQ